MSSGAGYVAGSSYPFIVLVLDDYMTEWRDAEVVSVEGRCQVRVPKRDPMPFRKPIGTLESARCMGSGCGWRLSFAFSFWVGALAACGRAAFRSCKPWHFTCEGFEGRRS
jgi:hypothetical protein